MAHKDDETILPPTLLTLRQVARVLGTTEGGVRALVVRGDLPAIRVGARLRITPEALEKWIAAGGSPARPRRPRRKR